VKEYTALLTLTAVLLAISSSSAQEGKPPAAKYEKDALIYAELTLAPKKARAKGNPLEKDPEAVAAG